jgi:hypothetical protein
VIHGARPMAGVALCVLVAVSAAAAAPPKPPAPGVQRAHEVVRGDTLFGLVRR